MSLKDNLVQFWEDKSSVLKTKVFGENNERIDFLMDSFYKLNPNQRNIFLIGGSAALGVLILSAFLLYFSQAKALERELSDSVAALQEIKTIKKSSNIETRRFKELASMIRKKININFKPFFEKLAESKNVSIREIDDKKVEELSESDPLAAYFKKVELKMSLDKISIPRVLSFITGVEKSNHYIRLKNLKITGIYGNKLFFNTSLEFSGYKLR